MASCRRRDRSIDRSKARARVAEPATTHLVLRAHEAAQAQHRGRSCSPKSISPLELWRKKLSGGGRERGRELLSRFRTRVVDVCGSSIRVCVTRRHVRARGPARVTESNVKSNTRSNLAAAERGISFSGNRHTLAASAPAARARRAHPFFSFTRPRPGSAAPRPPPTPRRRAPPPRSRRQTAPAAPREAPSPSPRTGRPPGPPRRAPGPPAP